MQPLSANYRALVIVALMVLLTPLTSWAFSSDTDEPIVAVAIQPNGKIIIGGDFTSVNGEALNRIARLNADGSVDQNFNPSGPSGSGANLEVLAVAVQADGKIIIGGNFTSINGVTRNHIARLDTDGSLDTSFDPGTGANGIVFDVAIQADGKIIIGGAFTSVINGATYNNIARLDSDGSVDASFNPDPGMFGFVFDVAVQADAKIIIGGGFTSINTVTRNRIARLNANGSLDTDFDPGTGANDFVNDVAVQTDDKIIIGGGFTNVNGVARNYIARLNASGGLDGDFNPGTVANMDVLAVAIQADGKIVIGGGFTRVNDDTRNRIARLEADGSLDEAFGPGTTGANGDVLAVAVQADGKIVIGGEFTSVNDDTHNHIARLHANGSLDDGSEICFPVMTNNNNVAIICM